MNKEITCKYCGSIDEPKVSAGKGPHAYRGACKHCGKFSLWMSKYDVEEFTDEYLISRYHQLNEFISDKAGTAPFHIYADEKREIKRIIKIIGERKINVQ